MVVNDIYKFKTFVIGLQKVEVLLHLNHFDQQISPECLDLSTLKQ